jgi:hypothetical protein
MPVISEPHLRRRQSPKRRVIAVCLIATLWSTPSSAQTTEAATKGLLDAYVGILREANPIVGAVAEGVVKVLDFAGFFKEPDPHAAAMRAINARLDLLRTQIGQLEAHLNAIQNEQMRERNLQRLWRLRDIRNELKIVATAVAQKPTDPTMKGMLADRAKNELDKMLDIELWTWSDLAVKDHTWPPRSGNTVRAGTMTAPDFKSLPTLDYYMTALAVWISAVQWASNGNPQWIVATQGAAIDPHLAFLTLRPGFDRGEGQPTSLPEHVQRHITSRFEPDTWPRNGVCSVSEFILDVMGRRYTYVQELTYQVRSPNELCSVPWAGRGDLSTEKEDELDRAYGTVAMELAAHMLRKLKQNGTVGEQFIGVFDSTTYAATDLYQVRSDGDLAWRRHMRGMKPAPPAQRTGPPIGGKVSGPIGGGSSGPLVEGFPVEPETTSHRMIGPTATQRSWGYSQVFSGGQGVVYAVAGDGRLLWYKHDERTGSQSGGSSWIGPKEVGIGWGFRHVFAAGDGIIYGLDNEGRLRWYKHNAWLTGAGLDDPAAWDPRGSTIVQEGWTDVKHMFAGGKGVIYVVTGDGRLLWYRHNRYLDPIRHPSQVPASRPPMVIQGLRVAWERSWEGPKEVGQGWNFAKVFSPGSGSVYAVTSEGRLVWYKHLAFDGGGPLWWADANGQQFVDLGGGWGGSSAAFATLESAGAFRGPR